MVVTRFHEGDLASIKAMQSVKIKKPCVNFIFVSAKEIPFSVLTLMFNEGAYGVLQEPFSEAATIQLVRQAIKRSKWLLDEAGQGEELKRSNELLKKTVERQKQEITRLDDLSCKLERLGYVLLSEKGFKTSNVKILTVSDSAYQRSLIEERFAEVGYQARGAPNAEEALKMVKSFKPDIVVSDLELPGMSGVDLAKELKGNKEYPQIYFVILTANEDKEDYVMSPGTMVDDCVIKPSSPAEYYDIVTRISLGILTL